MHSFNNFYMYGTFVKNCFELNFLTACENELNPEKHKNTICRIEKTIFLISFAQSNERK